MGPEDRAADRAERFGEYRDKRTDEATGHADRFDAGPHVHGFQSQARADRSAARHDRIGTYAVDAWSKAEYWQRRTAGVISHALHVSSPGVRMGRIKTIEAELRKERAEIEKRAKIYRIWEKIRAIEDPEKQTRIALAFTGSTCQWAEYPHPLGPTAFSRDGESSLYSLLSGVNLKSEEDIKPRPEKHTIPPASQAELDLREAAALALNNGRPLHDALMSARGWPEIPFDGRLLVTHQDALLMGGKVQAMPGYADHVVFLDRQRCISCLEKTCICMCSGQAITLGPEGAPAFEREKCVHCGACLWNCPHSPDGERSNIEFQAGAGGLHSGEN